MSGHYPERICLLVGGGESRYGPGVCYEVPAGVKHAARFDEDADKVEFWFQAPPGADRR